MYASPPSDRLPIFLCFDEGEWSCFAVLELSNRTWGVLHTRVAIVDAQPISGHAELLAGLPSRQTAVSAAAALANRRFAAAAARDSTRPRTSPLVTAVMAPRPPAADTGGAATQIGPVIRTGHTGAPGVGGRSA
jgi:hypothetical protein